MVGRCKKILTEIEIDTPTADLGTYVARRCYEVKFGCSREDFKELDREAEEKSETVKAGTVTADQARRFYTYVAALAARELA